jgi:hypothetical protein
MAKRIKPNQPLEIIARDRFGIPELDATTVSRLKGAGIHELGDALFVDTDRLRARSGLDEKLVTRLRQMAAIRNATGLSPRNVYALVHLGGITRPEELEDQTEEDIRTVLKTALDEGIISKAEARELELFVEHRMTQPVGFAFPTVHKVFSMLKEAEAAKLVEAGIRRASDLRSMDVQRVASYSEVRESHLQKLKYAAELVQIRGMTPEAAIALVEKAGVKGLEDLASLTPSSFVEKLNALAEAGLLDSTTVKLMATQSSRMIGAALTSVCQSSICSHRKYLDYLIDLLTPPSGTFDETVDSLSDRFKQDFGRSELRDSAVSLIEIVISVLERVVSEELRGHLSGYTASDLGYEDIERRAGETHRQWIDRMAALILYLDVFPPGSPWADRHVSLPDTVVGSEYVSALIELWIFCQERPITAAERVRAARELSAKYNINVLCGGCQETTWLKQAGLTLQGSLYEEGIPFKTYQEWCNGERVKHYPENAYEFKVSMFGEQKMAAPLGNVVGCIAPLLGGDLGFGNDDDHVRNLLHQAFTVLAADIKIVAGHDSLAQLELLRALAAYTEAEEDLIGALHSALGEVYGSGEDNSLEDLIGVGGVLWRSWPIVRAIEAQWGGDQFPGLGPSEPLDTVPYTAMRDLYEQRQLFVPQDAALASGDALTNILKFSDITSHSWCALHPGYQDAGHDCQALKVHLAVLVDRILGMILHYLYFLIPLSKGDVLRELGDYRSALWYYNVVYSLDTTETTTGPQPTQMYPYLNESIELPLIKIHHGRNLLEWADSLYRQNAPESLVQARYLYERVLDIHDDCIPSKEDQFDGMSRAIYALLDLDYDNLPAPSSSMTQLLEAVANLQYQPLRAQEIPGLYQAVEDVIRGGDGEQIATGLRDLLPLDVRFYESRDVFAVVGTSQPYRTWPVRPLDEMSAAARSTSEIMPIGYPCKPPCNPIIQAQIHKARMRLVQMERCLNILGYSDDMVPILRSEYLIGQARMFAEQAVAAEKDFIQFLSAAESEGLGQLTAQQAVQMSVANLEFEQARARIAQMGIETAKLQRSQVMQEIKDLEAEIREASDPIFAQAEWAQASDEYASGISFGFDGLGVSGAGQNNIMGGALGDLMGTLNSWTSSGDWKGWIQDPVNSVGNTVLGWLGFGQGEPPIETRRKAAAKARRNQINKLERQKALLQNYGMSLAQQQIDVAIAEHELAQRQVDIAQLQVEHAQQTLTFLKTKFLNRDLWYELAKEVRAIYRNLLDYAITTAFLAEQALEYQMNQRLDVIRFDYYRPGKQGLLGAENLQQDIAALAYQKTVLTEEKMIPVKAVISLAEEYPLEFLRFTQTGVTHFATDFGQFDLLFPGAYHSRISRVEVVIEGLVPPEGVHGTLATSGISYVRTRENQIRPLAGNPETMILSSYTIRGDEVVFHKTGEELELFEGLGVVTDWTLRMPKEANNMDYQTIADVKLVIYYAAFFDDNLRSLVLRRRPKGGDAYRAFSMRFQFPDGFYHFHNDITKSGNEYHASLSFETSDAYFPTNQEHRRIVNVDIALLSADTSLPAPLPFTLSSEPVDGGNPIVAAAEFTRQDGYRHVRAGSNVDVIDLYGTPEPPASQLNGFAGCGMNRTWELTLNLGPDDPNYPGFHPEFFKQNDAGEYVPDLSAIVDMLFFVEYQHDRTDLTIAEHFEDNATNWPDDIDSRMGQWEVEDDTYRGLVSGGRARSRLDVDSALSRFPSEARDGLKSAISDNVMVSFRTKLSAENTDDNDAQLFFADGNYLLSLGREGEKTQLSRLSTPYDSGTGTLLKETDDQDSLLKPDRWYTVQVGKFRGHIDVTIDGAEIINVYDAAPKEGADIAVGTSGHGGVYFDDILI